MIKPIKLNKWDTIAVISPSWWGANIFPHIYENWIKTLEKLWYKIKEYPSVKKKADFLYKYPEFRANDINKAFADKEVKAIISTIWWNESIRILKYLDTELILNNPKIFMWYSDITTINTYLNQLWLVTFNWPQIMAWLSQWDNLWEVFQKSFINFFENNWNYEYKAFDFYSNWYKDWSDINNIWKLKEKITNEWWNVLKWNWKFNWELFWWCLQTLESLKWTKYFPNTNFFENKIFFLEIAEDNGVQLNSVKYTLRNYAVSWVFNKINWLLIWRARDYSNKEKVKLNQVILDIIVWEFWITDLPIITNLDFGHTDPQWILPLWINTEFDIDNLNFKLLESCWKK